MIILIMGLDDREHAASVDGVEFSVLGELVVVVLVVVVLVVVVSV
jgi:hypothetical protein